MNKWVKGIILIQFAAALFFTAPDAVRSPKNFCGNSITESPSYQEQENNSAGKSVLNQVLPGQSTNRSMILTNETNQEFNYTCEQTGCLSNQQLTTFIFLENDHIPEENQPKLLIKPS